MESLIVVLPAEFRPTARLSGYLSVAASAFAIPGLLYVSLYLTKSLMGVMHIKFSEPTYIKASKSYIVTYILCEITRMALFYLFVYRYIHIYVGNPEFLDSDIVANWRQMQDILILLFIFCAPVFFLLDCADEKEVKTPILDYLVLFLPAFFIPLAANYKAVFSVLKMVVGQG